MLASYELNAAGWGIMIVSLTSVFILVSYCLIRVLTLPPLEEETLKAPMDIDTRDHDN